MTDLKIRIKRPTKRPAQPSAAQGGKARRADSLDDDDADDGSHEVDKRDLADGTYRPNQGGRRKPKSSSASLAAAAAATAKVAMPAPKPPLADSSSRSPQAAALGSTPGHSASAPATGTHPSSSVLPLPLGVETPPPARQDLRGPDGKELVTPEKYRSAKDLTAEEALLLDKFSRAKRVVLTVPKKLNEAAARARAKQDLERDLERKRRERVLDRERNIVKRPRVTGLSHDAGPDDTRRAGFGASTGGLARPSSAARSYSSGPPPLPAHLTGGGSRFPPPPRPGAVGDAVPKSSQAGAGSEYDEEGVLLHSDWHTQEHNEPLILELPRLKFTQDPSGARGGNTVVIWMTMPVSSERFCVNISPTPAYDEKDPATVVLYHFNPRDGWGKRHIVQNTFERGSWGQHPERAPSMPIKKGERFKLEVRVLPTEFVVTINGVHLTTFQNRCSSRYLRPDASLYLIVPVIETHFGDKEDVIVHRVWWGCSRPGSSSKPAIAAPPPVPGAAPPGSSVPGSAPPLTARFTGTQPSRVPGGAPPLTNANNRPGHHRDKFHKPHAPHARGNRFEERQLFVSGLPMEAGPAYNELLRLFEPYGLAKHNGEPIIRAIEGKGFGFVTLNSASSCEEAIGFLDNRPGVAGAPLSVMKARKKERRH